MRNFSPTDERRPQGLRTHIHTLTVRAFSGCSAKNFAQHAIKHRFWAILSTLGELFRAHTHTRPRRANFFAHSTRRRGNFETSNTFAHHAARSLETTNTFARHTARPHETTNTFARHTARPIETDNTFARHAAHPIETDNTFAGSKWHKNGLSSLAKAMAVSFRCKEVLAKVLSVSWRGTNTPTMAPGTSGWYDDNEDRDERSPPPVVVGPGRQQAPENSHVIRLKEVSTTAENVAIPTRRIQDLKESQGNYVRNL